MDDGMRKVSDDGESDPHYREMLKASNLLILIPCLVLTDATVP